MSTPKIIQGVLPVFQTPFDEQLRIDEAILQREIEWLYMSGADGIVMAMVSEVLRLSTEERKALAAMACKHGARRAVIISVGAESTHTAVELARHAENAGADALMAIPPVTVGLGDAEVIGYYEAILKATRIPLVVQDASGYVGKPLPIETQARLAREFDARIFFKPEAPPIGQKLSALRDASGGKARIFEGTGGIALVDSYRRGIVGTMPGADLIQGIVALWNALQAGDDRRIYRLSLPVSGIISMATSLDAFLAIEKHLLVQQGIFKNTLVRGPSGYTLDRETRLEVDRLFAILTESVATDKA